MNPIRMAKLGVLLIFLLATGCKSKSNPETGQSVADRHLFNQIFCQTETDGEKAVRERDFARTAFIGWLRGEPDYQEYIFSWLKQKSMRESVYSIVATNFLHSAIKKNPVNKKVAIVDPNGRSKCLLDDDKGFSGFYELDEAGRISTIEKFCDQIFPPE